MALLELILIFALHFEGIIGQIQLYHRPGHDVILPCEKLSQTCSIAQWLYGRNRESKLKLEAINGKVQGNSARAARLTLDTTCSLHISSIIAEDAGQYVCRPGNDNRRDTPVFLNILTISLSPPDADPQRDGEVTVECSLLRYSGSCRTNTIRWVDEAGNVLLGEGVGYQVSQTNCVSALTVRRQSGSNRTYTCQFVDSNMVKIEADFTTDFTDPPSIIIIIIIIIIGAVVGVVLLLVAIAAVLIKYKKRTKETEGNQKPTRPPDEPDSSLTYVTVSHVNQKSSAAKRVKKEENVTYSTIKTPVK